MGCDSVGKVVRVDPPCVCAGPELHEDERSCGWGRLSCAVGHPDETGESSLVPKLPHVRRGEPWNRAR